MLVEIDINKHNFSKIGKYISNKLHHIHKSSSKHTIPTQETFTQRKQKQHQSVEPSTTQRPKHFKKKIEQWPQPCVGTYRVNYSVVDKNVHISNFNRSTPHFFGIKYHANQATPTHKDYPDGLKPHNKGFTELGRMAGREEVTGSVRKNHQNPHQTRFERHQFPTLAYDSKGVSFAKMSPRKDIMVDQNIVGAQYNGDFKVKMKRLDSHIVPFQKQTKRPQVLFTPQGCAQNCQYDVENIKQTLDKSVEWSRQLAREADGAYPGYMQKTLNSRLAIGQLNHKTLQMNCTELKERRKLPRKMMGTRERTVYFESHRQS